MKKRMPLRYYSTRSAMDSPGILKDLEGAITDAQRKVQTGNDPVYVVEVVRIVRRTAPIPPPIEVVTVVE